MVLAIIQRYFPITSFEVDLILGDRNIQVELINGEIGTPENFVFLGTYTKLLGGGEIFKYELIILFSHICFSSLFIFKIFTDESLMYNHCTNI